MKDERHHLDWAYPADAQPFIKRHIDGPLLCMRTGELHWLTLIERIQWVCGWTDAYKLERKHSICIPTTRPASMKGEQR